MRRRSPQWLRRAAVLLAVALALTAAPCAPRGAAAQQAAEGAAAGGTAAAPQPAADGAGAAAPAPQPPFQCPPAWLAEYEAFHRAARGQPGAKYLLHAVRGIYSGGIGDRMRGMLYTLRAAVASQRVVLFDWSYPHHLSNFLEPTDAINWTTAGLDLPPAGQQLRFVDTGVPQVESGSLSGASDQLISLETNQHLWAACAGCPNMTDWSQEAACAASRLWKPTEEILQRAKEHTRQLYGDADARYVAVHMRLGGMTGEKEYPVDWTRGGGTPFSSFLRSVRCANQLAKQEGIAVPTLMITDNHALRNFLKEKNLPNILTPDITPVHIDLAASEDVEKHKTSFVDFALLARATCLVTTNSGFSHQAWLYGGGKPCRKPFFDCVAHARTHRRSVAGAEAR